MEMVATYIDVIAKDAIDRHGFSKAVLTVDDQELELWVKEHKDDRNKGELTLAAGFTNFDHQKLFAEKYAERARFELFFKKGGFIYRFENCIVNSITPMQLRIDMNNGPLPFSLRNFEFRKFILRYDTQDGRTGLSRRR